MASRSPAAQVTRRRLASSYLRMLLADRPDNRALWSVNIGKITPGEVHQAGVAKVISSQMRADGSTDEAAEDYRLLKDLVHRALNGTALTPATLRLFCAAFPFTDDDHRQLWSLLLGTPSGEDPAAFRAPQYQVALLEQACQLDAQGHLYAHTTRQRVIATHGVLDRVAVLLEHSSAQVAVLGGGELTQRYECGDQLYAFDVVLATPVPAGESAEIGYQVVYPPQEASAQTVRIGTLGQRIDQATIALRFHRDHLPETVWWTLWPPYGRGREPGLREQVPLNRDGRVAKTVGAVSNLVMGFCWAWPGGSPPGIGVGRRR